MKAARPVIVGRRNRVIGTAIRQDAVTMSCEWMLENQAEANTVLDGPGPVIFLGYLREAGGRIDRKRSIDLAALVHRACRSDMSRVIYLSTDAVFSGAVGGYSTADLPSPGTEYGAMKREQEIVLEGACIVRFTVFGPTFSDRAMLSDIVCVNAPLTLYPNAFFSPVSTFKVNDVLRAHLENRTSPGTYHLATERVSKANLVPALRAAQACTGAADYRIDPAQQSDFSLNASEGLWTASMEEELEKLALWHRSAR